MSKMRLVVHDYGAFAFPVQLSRELSRRGHTVLHLYSDFEPHGGRLKLLPGDPDGFRVEPVSINEAFQKYSFRKRAVQELKYAGALEARVSAFGPDVVISANAPILVARSLEKSIHRAGSRYVHWTQDIHTLALRQVLPERYGPIGSALATFLQSKERRAIESADATIVISADFEGALNELGIKPDRVFNVPNWMPLDEMKPEPKANPWAVEHGLADTLNIMYVGTMSYKHDHMSFVHLAEAFAMDPSVRVVVVGAGISWDRLAEAKKRRRLDNLVLFGWQKYEDIAYVMATGDILVSAIAPDASRYSVPCKVLSYLSAQRPVLAAIPSDNLVRKLMEENSMGLAADPSDTEALVAAAWKLVRSPELRARISENARAYAERTFNITKIGDQFEDILEAI